MEYFIIWVMLDGYIIYLFYILEGTYIYNFQKTK